MTQPYYIGVDICSKRLDIYHGGCYDQINFKKEIVLPYFKDLQKKHDSIQLIFEATSNLSKQLIAWINGVIPFSCLNPYRVRQFAVGCNMLAKTDREDAILLYHYGCIQRPKVKTVLSQAQLKAQEYESLLSSLTRQKAKYKCRLKGAFDERECDILRDLINILEEKEQELENLLCELINVTPLLKLICNEIQKVKGIGLKSAIRIVVSLPELGSLTSKEISSLVGVCPYQCESGQKKGAKTIKTGRSITRSALYMCSVVACRYNDVIKNFYQRLLKAGKKKKSALMACAHKLLIHINFIAKRAIKTINAI